MSSRTPKTNKALLWTAIALCAVTGGSYTRSSADFTSGSSSQPDMFVAENTADPADTEAGAAEAAGESLTEAETAAVSETSASAETVSTDTPTPEPTAEPTAQPASPEAENGVWTSSGSSWYFMVDGAALTGWLTDTDGKRYYFDANGIMQTGWLELDGKKYYLNADGIMQTGDVTIDGQVYTFGSDGVLTGEAAAGSAGQELLSYMNTAAQATPTAAPAPTAIPTA